MLVQRRASEITSKNLGYFKTVGDSTKGYLLKWVPSGNPANDITAQAYSAATGKKYIGKGNLTTSPVVTPPVTPPPTPPATGTGSVRGPVERPDPYPSNLTWTEITNTLSIPAGTTDYIIENVNFLNETYKGIVYAPREGRRVVFRNCRIRTRGSLVFGFRGRITIENCDIEMLPPVEYGKAWERLIKMEEMIDFVFRNNTVREAGAGIFASGLNGVFNGNAAKGDGLLVENNEVWNIDGRRSDGAGSYIKSNVSPIHAGFQTFKDNGAIKGYEISNFIQMDSMPKTPIVIRRNKVLQQIGKSRVEDMISTFGGSGGSPTYPGIIEDNIFDNSGGWDWNWDGSVNTPYNASNQITLNAVGYQDVSRTRYSGTSILIGDENRTLYENNTSYLTVKNNIGLGARPYISQLFGHHNRLDGNVLISTKKHWSGVTYTGYTSADFWVVDTTGGAKDPNTGEYLWSYNEFYNQIYYSASVTKDTVYGTPPAMTKNGSSGGNNFKKPIAESGDDGGLTLIVRWHNRMVANGYRIGSTLP